MKNSSSKSADPLQLWRRHLTPLLTRHATHVVAGLAILLLDFWSGPLLMFPILFIIPVVLSAWYCSARLAYALAVLLPLGRFLIAVFTDVPGSVIAGAANSLIRGATLSFIAFLVTHTARQSREIKVLRGLLPICMFCKRIRNEGESWQQLEAYIAEHSEADFTHGLCPECAHKHYGDLIDTKETPNKNL